MMIMQVLLTATLLLCLALADNAIIKTQAMAYKDTDACSAASSNSETLQITLAHSYCFKNQKVTSLKIIEAVAPECSTVVYSDSQCKNHGVQLNASQSMNICYKGNFASALLSCPAYTYQFG